MRPRPSTEPRLPHNRSMGRVLFSRLGCNIIFEVASWKNNFSRLSFRKLYLFRIVSENTLNISDYGAQESFDRQL